MAIIRRETDYALRALLRLARQDGWVPVSELAEAEGAPELFLRKIMQALHHAGIVESRQGALGGYRLGRRPQEVNVRDVLEAAQGPLAMNECFARPGVCDRAPRCPLRRRLARLQEALDDDLAAMSLADVLGTVAAAEG